MERLSFCSLTLPSPPKQECSLQPALSLRFPVWRWQKLMALLREDRSSLLPDRAPSLPRSPPNTQGFTAGLIVVGNELAASLHQGGLRESKKETRPFTLAGKQVHWLASVPDANVS